MEELRKKVQQLQQRLELYEALERNQPHRASEDEESANGEDEINPFYRARSRASSDEAGPYRHARRNYDFQRDYDIKVDIREFEGRIKADEFIDWLNPVERIFDYKDVPEHFKVKLVAIKLKKHASIWWEHLKKQRAHDGKIPIVTFFFT